MELTSINSVVNFTIDRTAVTGRMLKLDLELNKVLDLHNYPENVARLLAELLALTTILSSTISDFSVVSLQVKSTNAPIKLMVADYYADGTIRGYADYNRDYFRNDYLEKRKKLQDYFGKGNILVHVEQTSKNSHQTIVEIRDDSLAESVEHYYQSVQHIQTKIKIAVGKISTQKLKNCWCVGGIMLQSLPHDNHHLEIAKNDWSEASLIFDSIEDHELLDLSVPASDLLPSLFHENGVIIHYSKNVKQGCQCNISKFDELYHNLVLKDDELLKTHDKVVIKCEFCSSSKEYVIKKR